MWSKGSAICIPGRKGYVSGVYFAKLFNLAVEYEPHMLSQGAKAAIHHPRDDLEGMEFPYEDYLSLVSSVLARNPSESLGLKFGATFGPRDYGILGYALLSCSSLRQCLTSFQNLGRLFGDLEEHDYRLLWSRDGVTYRYAIHHIQDEQLVRFELQTAFSQFMAMRKLVEHPWQFKVQRLTFSFPAPRDVKPYVDLFGLVPNFNSDVSELTVANSALDEPFALANEDVRRICEEQCVILARSMTEHASLPLNVRKQILRSPGTVPELAAVAGELGMSERTLRRRLAQAGTSFHEIVSDVRRHLACRYLAETGMAIKEISYLLGYSEVANFHRAFKKQVGTTPGEYRERVRGTSPES